MNTSVQTNPRFGLRVDESDGMELKYLGGGYVAGSEDVGH